MAGKIDQAEGFFEPMSFTEMSENVTDDPWSANYANVYQKGALFGMCNDIAVRVASGGQRSLIDVTKALQDKYGAERPFDDDTFIDEFTAFTTPGVGDFLTRHVVGTEPVDWSDCLAPVGLVAREVEGPSTLFAMITPEGGVRRAWLTQRPGGAGIYFPHGRLNSILESLGVEGGDRLVSLQGKPYAVTDFGTLLQASVDLAPDQEFRMVVERDGREVELVGTIGNPTGFVTVIEEIANPTPAQLALRDAWLGGND
jgi:predicted metalloprotease with PDZ domain